MSILPLDTVVAVIKVIYICLTRFAALPSVFKRTLARELSVGLSNTVPLVVAAVQLAWI